MRNKLASLFLMLCVSGLAMPVTTPAQNRDDDGYRRVIKRGKNGIRVGDHGINLFDGPGIVNYERRHRWMDSPAGAATVIGTGAAAGAVPRRCQRQEGRNNRRGCRRGRGHGHMVVQEPHRKTQNILSQSNV